MHREKYARLPCLWQLKNASRAIVLNSWSSKPYSARRAAIKRCAPDGSAANTYPVCGCVTASCDTWPRSSSPIIILMTFCSWSILSSVRRIANWKAVPRKRPAIAGPEACSGTSVCRHHKDSNWKYLRSGYLATPGRHPGGVPLVREVLLLCHGARSSWLRAIDS